MRFHWEENATVAQLLFSQDGRRLFVVWAAHAPDEGDALAVYDTQSGERISRFTTKGKPTTLSEMVPFEGCVDCPGRRTSDRAQRSPAVLLGRRRETNDPPLRSLQ